MFFGPIQEATGTKATALTIEPGTTVAELITDLTAEYEGLEERLLTDNGEIRDSLVFTVNKRHIRHLEGEATELSDGDTVRITTSIQGG